SITEFKQIIGRGTRVRDDYGKLYFNILDYTGSATRLFADPDFDGDPALISEEQVDEAGKVKSYEILAEDHSYTAEVSDYAVAPQIPDDSEGERRKYYFDG